MRKQDLGRGTRPQIHSVSGRLNPCSSKHFSLSAAHIALMLPTNATP